MLSSEAATLCLPRLVAAGGADGHGVTPLGCGLDALCDGMEAHVEEASAALRASGIRPLAAFEALQRLCEQVQ